MELWIIFTIFFILNAVIVAIYPKSSPINWMAIGACLVAIVWSSSLSTQNRQIKSLKERAIKERAAVFQVNPNTGKKEFIWISDLFNQ